MHTLSVYWVEALESSVCWYFGLICLHRWVKIFSVQLDRNDDDSDDDDSDGDKDGDNEGDDDDDDNNVDDNDDDNNVDHPPQGAITPFTPWVAAFLLHTAHLWCHTIHTPH